MVGYQQHLKTTHFQLRAKGRKNKAYTFSLSARVAPVFSLETAGAKENNIRRQMCYVSCFSFSYFLNIENIKEKKKKKNIRTAQTTEYYIYRRQHRKKIFYVDESIRRMARDKKHKVFHNSRKRMGGDIRGRRRSSRCD